jgi:hypothetical protein
MNNKSQQDGAILLNAAKWRQSVIESLAILLQNELKVC